MTIKLLPDAEDDLYKALEYYQGIDRKLKDKFINELDNTFEKILKFPNLYPFETQTSQKILMHKFPYIILYEKYQNIIMILAIFHTKRNPRDLTDRIL